MEQLHTQMCRFMLQIVLQYKNTHNIIYHRGNIALLITHNLCTFLIFCISFPVVQCNRLKAPHNAIISCENPLGEHSYGSTCTVECNKGFDLIGTNTTKCSSQGQWSPQLPVCQGKITHGPKRQSLFGCFRSFKYIRQALV